MGQNIQLSGDQECCHFHEPEDYAAIFPGAHRPEPEMALDGTLRLGNHVKLCNLCMVLDLRPIESQGGVIITSYEALHFMHYP
jgi:hypothetical protein